MSLTKIYLKRKFKCEQSVLGENRQTLFFPHLPNSMSLHNDTTARNIHINSSISTTMTSQETSVVQLPIASTQLLRSLILKKHISTLYAQLTEEKKADPHLTRMILLNMFQKFQINKIHFEQNL